eukprot:1322973-Alexandrium_andersonii.AAC.1
MEAMPEASAAEPDEPAPAGVVGGLRTEAEDDVLKMLNESKATSAMMGERFSDADAKAMEG